MSASSPHPALPAALAAVASFRSRLRTVILGTASPTGEPDASVAATVLDPAGAFIVAVSGLAAHTRHLAANPRASVLLVADDADTPNPLARLRLTFACTADPVSASSPSHAPLVAALRGKFGATIDVILSLPDFRLYRLVPASGRLVVGFGAAFSVSPADWTDLTPIGPPAR